METDSEKIEKPQGAVPKPERERKKPDPKAESVVAEQKKLATTIYVGPNIRGGRLAQFTIFRGELPAHVSKLLEEQPHIKSLIVPVARLSEAYKRSKSPGTIEYRAAQTLRGGE